MNCAVIDGGMKTICLLSCLLLVACDEQPQQAAKPYDYEASARAGRLESERNAVDIAASYGPVSSGKSYDRQADEELQAWAEQQKADHFARNELLDAVDAAELSAQYRHDDQMNAIENSRREAPQRVEDDEEKRRLESYRKVLPIR